MKPAPGNIFGPHLEKQGGCHRCFLTISKEFCWPSRANSIVCRDLKLAGYVHRYKILTWKICGLILKSKMAAMGVSLSVMKMSYISLIIGKSGLACEANQ